MANKTKLPVLNGESPIGYDHTVSGAYAPYPLTIQGADDDVADAAWDVSEGTRLARGPKGSK